jgi:citronellyl-CoA dehydrogenase
MWITNSHVRPTSCCLLANTSDDKPRTSQQVADRGADEEPWHHVSPHLDKIGMRILSDTAQVFFDNVRVPRRYVIGHEGMPAS